MITIISPATTMNFDRSLNLEITTPYFKDDINKLINLLQSLSKDEVSNIMNLSDDLSELNFNRYKELGKSTTVNAPSILAFDGQVFNCINVDDFTSSDFEFANEHLRIMSGLYGALRPTDAISPYRLEMKAKLKNEEGNDLYKFWKDKITEYLKQQLLKQDNQVLVNLASNEYSKAINLKSLSKDFSVINIEFKDYKENLDAYKVIGLYSKKARGYLTRYIIKNKIDNINDLKDFKHDGYEFNSSLSDDNNFIFTR